MTMTPPVLLDKLANNEPLQINEFYTVQMLAATRFFAYWKRKQAECPQNFPHEMPLEDWEEQFAFWADLEEVL
jgi:hypothetical protein